MPLQPKDVRSIEIGRPFLDPFQKIQAGSFEAFADMWTTFEIRKLEVCEQGAVPLGEVGTLIVSYILLIASDVIVRADFSRGVFTC